MQQRGVVGERDARRLQPPRALDPDRPRAADHDLVDLGVRQQRFERPEAERALRDPARELVAARRVEDPRLLVDERPDTGRDVALRIVLAGARDQLVAQDAGEGVEIVSCCHAGTRPARRSTRPGRVGRYGVVVLTSGPCGPPWPFQNVSPDWGVVGAGDVSGTTDPSQSALFASNGG